MPLLNVMIYGLGDAINPCNLSTVILFAALLGWLRQKGMPYAVLAWVFVVLAYVASLVYALGGLMSILYSVTFFQTMRIVYCGLGLVFCIIGLIHMIDWIKIRKGSSSALFLPFVANEVPAAKPLLQLAGRIMLTSSAVLLSGASTVWPMNKYVGFYTNYLGVPGEVVSTIVMLAVYCLMMIAPLIVVPFWMSWVSPSGWVTKYPSRAKAIISALILGVGINLVYVFH